MPEWETRVLCEECQKRLANPRWPGDFVDIVRHMRFKKKVRAVGKEREERGK